MNKHKILWITGLFTALVTTSSYRVMAQDSCAPFGWVNCTGDTYSNTAPTGGGTATPVVVTSWSDLVSYATSSNPQVIYIRGPLSGIIPLNAEGDGWLGESGCRLSIASNKTIIGESAGTKLNACILIDGKSNIILRNIIVQHNTPSNALQAWDNISIVNSASRIWVDHCEFWDGQDGNADVTKGANNVTFSWCKFGYKITSTHNLSNLIGGSDTETVSIGKLNVTYQYCWWHGATDRVPRARFGKIHVANCYFTDVNTTLQSNGGVCAGLDANMLVENCHFVGIPNPIDNGKLAGTAVIESKGNKFTTCTGNMISKGMTTTTAFTPPYPYTLASADQVEALVTNPTSGAGATMLSPTQCGNTTEINSNLSKALFIQTENSIIVESGQDIESIEIYSLSGALISTSNSNAISIKNIQKGVSLINFKSKNTNYQIEKIFIK